MPVLQMRFLRIVTFKICIYELCVSCTHTQIHTHVFVWVSCIQMKVRGHHVGDGSLLSCDPKNGTQVVRRGNKDLYSVSHLSEPCCILVAVPLSFLNFTPSTLFQIIFSYI